MPGIMKNIAITGGCLRRFTGKENSENSLFHGSQWQSA